MLEPGTKLGPYEILAPLGAGGMGEVYRARDTRLGREVAVKVLPEHLSANEEIRARFEREAKTVSSLNHPNICTLFDVGREGADRLPGDGAGRGRDAAPSGCARGRSPAPSCCGSACRSPTRSTARTAPASSTGTSSPGTSC